MMRKTMFVGAIAEALREELKRDDKVFLIGEDLNIGTFGQTVGLLKEFGPERIRCTPISEAGFTGAAIGAAMCGMRPVVEYMFSNLTFSAMDQIVNQAGKLPYMYGGQINLPVTFRSLNVGAGSAGQHCDSAAGYFMHTIGVKVIMPSTPYDAKGLLKSAIRDNNPVFFFEEAKLFMRKGEIPDEDYTIPIGKGDIKREGKDVTVVAAGFAELLAESAAEKLSKESISVEVIDPRTLVPLDEEIILNSVKKTGRLVVCIDEQPVGSLTSEIAALVSEKGFEFLKAPIKRVARENVSVPASAIMEGYVLLNEDKIIKAVKEVLK
jgi:pyruvate dehydrogenase E1 component beta subunit